MIAELKTKDAIRALLDSIDCFLFDCDGVIWLGDTLVPYVAETLQLLRSLGKKILFVSNNSTKSRLQYKHKFDRLNLVASEDEIFGSSYAAAVYVKSLALPCDQKVYVCGMKGIEDELASEGIPFIGGENETDHVSNISEIEKIKPDPSIGAVLFGFDINISYTKLAKAFTYLHSNPNCHFLATNDDSTFPTGGTVYPGTGALLAALSHPLGRKPKVLGKPHQTMLDVIIAKYHLDRNRTCMVGDRLNTDIEFGKLGGLKTLLVLTGVTKRSDLASSSVLPDFLIESLGEVSTRMK